MSRKMEAFPRISKDRPVADDASLPSPLALLSEALDEHFTELKAHFCRGVCAEDILERMNARELYIVTDTTLTLVHGPCQAQLQWYREALETIRDGTSMLKAEVIAKIALNVPTNGDT